MADKSDKREAILDAMLELIAERGFHNAPMSVLARKSGASPGVIYHYFPSKDDIIHALYKKIAMKKRDAFLEGYSEKMSPRESFLHIWLNAYRFYRTHLPETRFLDQYLNSPYCNPNAIEKEGRSDPTTARLLGLMKPRKKGGILRELPPEAVQNFTFDLAANLAKAPKSFSPSTLRAVAESAWLAIADE